MEVAHPTDINFHLNYSAVIKCQDNLTETTTLLLLKCILKKLIKFIVLFPSPSVETPCIYFYQEIRCSHATPLKFPTTYKDLYKSIHIT